MPNLVGRSAIVVAGHDPSLATEVAEKLADLGARVLVACAEPEKCQQRLTETDARVARSGITQRIKAIESSIESSTKRRGRFWRRRRRFGPPLIDSGVELQRLDLSDPVAVWDFAERVEEEDRPLHIFINCADDIYPVDKKAASGWERTFAVNHLGPFLLTTLLTDQMARTMQSDARLLAKERKQVIYIQYISDHILPTYAQAPTCICTYACSRGIHMRTWTCSVRNQSHPRILPSLLQPLHP